MRTCDALVLTGPRTLERRTMEIGERPHKGGAWLYVEACGLCGTDHEQFSGDLPAGFAFVPGHETIGIVEEIDDQTSQRLGVECGDRVAVEVFQSCRECAACRSGEYRRCVAHGIGDMYGFVPVEKEPGLWGGYAQYQFLSPDSMLHKVPTGLDPAVATIFNPLGAGIRWGAIVPETRPGDVVAVLGPGIRGLCACAAAKTAGAGFIMITGKGARDAKRLKAASQFGADLCVDVESEDPVAVLKESTGGLADIVVDVTAKAPSALAQAIALARPGGTIVVAGTRGSAETPGFWPDLIVYKELRILGALGVDAPAYKTALDMIEQAAYPFDQLDRRCAGLDQAADLLETMGSVDQDPPIHGVILPWS